MQTAIPIIQIIAGFALILFGAWVTWRGIRIITQYYPLTIKTGSAADAFTEGGAPTNLVGAMMSLVNAEIASLGGSKRGASFVDLDTGSGQEEGDGTPGGAGDPPPDGDAGPDTGQPVEPAEPIEPVIPVEPSAGGEDKGTVLEGAAKIIEALPKLLNANFGPATVVCLVGLVIIAGGFYMLLQLTAGA